jgi:hypothetical protein
MKKILTAAVDLKRNKKSGHNKKNIFLIYMRKVMRCYGREKVEK